ncbi:MAG: hypothetical protein ACI9VR_001520 [Cognaticolwellia sp.]|jgi:hypothetical protein
MRGLRSHASAAFFAHEMLAHSFVLTPCGVALRWRLSRIILPDRGCIDTLGEAQDTVHVVIPVDQASLSPALGETGDCDASIASPQVQSTAPAQRRHPMKRSSTPPAQVGSRVLRHADAHLKSSSERVG